MLKSIIKSILSCFDRLNCLSTVNHTKFLEKQDYLVPRRQDAKKNAESNFINLAESQHRERDLVIFIKDKFNSADVSQQLFRAIEKIKTRFKNNPVFNKSIDTKRWIYILLGVCRT